MKNYFKILVLLIIAFLCQYKACAQSNFSSNPKEVILIDGKTTDSVVIYNNFKIGDKSLIRFVDCTVVVKGNLIAEGLPKMIFVNSKMLVYGRLNVKSKNIQKVRIVKRKIK